MQRNAACQICSRGPISETTGIFSRFDTFLPNLGALDKKIYHSQECSHHSITRLSRRQRKHSSKAQIGPNALFSNLKTYLAAQHMCRACAAFDSSERLPTLVTTQKAPKVAIFGKRPMMLCIRSSSGDFCNSPISAKRPCRLGVPPSLALDCSNADDSV